MAKTGLTARQLEMFLLEMEAMSKRMLLMESRMITLPMMKAVLDCIQNKDIAKLIRDNKELMLISDVAVKYYNKKGTAELTPDLWVTPEREEEPEPKEPEPVQIQTDLKDIRHAWISPAGEFYPVGYMCHIHESENLADGSGMSEAQREEAGWMKMSSEKVHMGYRKGRDLKPTQAQLDAVFDWMQANEKQTLDFAGMQKTYSEWLEYVI